MREARESRARPGNALRKVEFDPSRVGSFSEPDEFEVSAERIVAYAEATNDPIGAHRAAQLAPPVFAIVPSFNALIPVALSVAPATLIPKLLHGEQDFRFHRPIRPGTTIVTRAKATGFRATSAGSTVSIYIECREGHDGPLVNEQWMVAFFRGCDAGSYGDSAPAHVFPAELREARPVASVVQHVDADQTFRYSPAAGDPMPIHLDDDIAKASGLPGIIAHGLCTMAFTSWAAITELAGGDTRRLARLAVRFSKPVLPGSDIETRFYDAGPLQRDGATMQRYAFETSMGDAVVITDGVAEIRA